MQAPRAGVERSEYCTRCLCTRTMKILADNGSLCYVCGTEYGPRIQKDLDAWRKAGEAEARWQTDMDHSE